MSVVGFVLPGLTTSENGRHKPSLSLPELEAADSGDSGSPSRAVPGAFQEDPEER